ncbi:hypothetical protein GIB67_002272, partial [Kingdonia uniflora]
SFEVDISNTKKLLEGELGRIIREMDVIVVGKSGLFAPKDVSYVQEAGVKAMLSDCIAVGYSLHHDIKGANIAGIELTFITGGIHATELALSSFGEFAESSSVQDLTSKYDAFNQNDLGLKMIHF